MAIHSFPMSCTLQLPLFYLALSCSDIQQFASTLALFRKKPDTPTREMQILATATQSLLSINCNELAELGVTRLTSVCDAEFGPNIATAPVVGRQATRRHETLQRIVVPLCGCFAADIRRRRVPRHQDACNKLLL
jgi:hypothetical protein